MGDWCLDHPNWFLGSIVVGILALFCLAVLMDARRIPQIALDRADWRCTDSHTETFTVFLPIGKIIMPQVHTRAVCDNYRRVN